MMLSSNFILGFVDINRNFLVCFEETKLIMFIQIASKFLYYVLCILFVVQFKMGIEGIALGNFLTNLIVMGI